MKRYFLVLIAALFLLPSLAGAQTTQLPGNVQVGGNLTAASGGPVNLGGQGVAGLCTWSVTTYGGAAAQTSNVACLSNFNHVLYAGYPNGATPTAVVTPGQAATTPQVNVNCAITAAGSTTVACLAPAGQATTVVFGIAF